MVSKFHVIAPFFHTASDRWLDDFIESPDLEFRKILNPSGKHNDWHHTTTKTTSSEGWKNHFHHAWLAFRGRPKGIITSFPQLAMCAGIIKRLTFRRTLIIAHNFNIGSLAPGKKRRFARFAAAGVNMFLVHSRSEIAPYADYLAVPENRFRFVPLQRGDINLSRDEDNETPFVLAMGSAHRDYPTLIKAVDKLKIRTIIVTRKDDIAELPQSPYVEFMSGLSQEDCLKLMTQARLSVTPISNMSTASGQVTFVNAMKLGVAVIATRCPGTEDYMENRETAILVPMGDVEALTASIAELWEDHDKRERFAQAGKRHAETYYSDEGAAKTLEDIILSELKSNAA